ncbi:MAG: 30S ribosomal protein S8 [Patescibacteria group bacterium]
MTDPIADMLTRIRNASAVNKEEVVIPFSKMKWEIAQILEREGFIKGAEKTKEVNSFGSEFDNITVGLRYSEIDGQPLVRKIKRVSTPGRRVYKKYQAMPHVLGGLGIAIISTSAGIMTNKEAKKKKVGGEIICEVY